MPTKEPLLMNHKDLLSFHSVLQQMEMSNHEHNIQNTLLKFGSTNKTNHSVRVASCSVNRVRKSLQRRVRQVALTEIFRQVYQIQSNKCYSFDEYHTKFWGVLPNKGTTSSWQKGYPCMFKGWIQFLLVLLSDHCESDRFFLNEASAFRNLQTSYF